MELLWLGLLLPIGAIALLFVGYLLLLLGAAAMRRPGKEAGAAGVRAVALVPAHNEELVLAATLQSLRAQNYPAGCLEIVVVADNCTDDTARIAQEAGATVWERTDTERRGKGYVLEWAIERLLLRDAADSDPALAFFIIDADTQVHPDFAAVLASHLFANVSDVARRTHCRALQGRYGVLNGQDSWRAALMGAAFDLFNHIKPLGRDRLGMSVGLKGNGMGFTRALFERARWQGRSITEDIDYGLDLLVEHGIGVGYVPEALVRAQMPTTAAQAASQRERWERGRYRLVRERAFPLLVQGLRRGDLRRIDAAIDLMTPPLAELAALHGLWIGVAWLGSLLGAPWRIAMAVALGSLGGFVLYVLGGLRLAGASRQAYLALLRAPLYAPWKLALYVLGLVKRGRASSQNEWVRTERAPVAAEGKRP